MKEKCEKVLDKKISTSIEELCKDLHPVFGKFLTNAQNLKFTEKPNYSADKQMFSDAMRELRYKDDYAFDWVEKGSIKFD